MYKRWSCGGLPVWQAEKFTDFVKSADGSRHHRPFAWFGVGLSFAIVAIPTGCAMTVSGLTPTEGFECRTMTQLSFLIMWLLSAGIDSGLSTWARARSSKAEDDTGISSRHLKIYLDHLCQRLCPHVGNHHDFDLVCPGHIQQVRVLVQVAQIIGLHQLPPGRLRLPTDQAVAFRRYFQSSSVVHC